MRFQEKDLWDLEERATPEMKLIAKYEEGKTNQKWNCSRVLITR